MSRGGLIRQVPYLELTIALLVAIFPLTVLLRAKDANAYSFKTILARKKSHA